MLFFTVNFSSMFYKQITKEPEVKIEYVEYLTRYEINDIIKTNTEEYVKRYAEKTKLEINLTRIIINEAIRLNIPVNIAFGLGYAETLLNNNIKPTKNKKDGSYDRGLFRLNSKTFPVVKKETFREQTVKALGYLYEKYVRYKQNWELALMTYNSGSIKNISDISINHNKRALDYERDLNEWFNNRYWSEKYRTFSSSALQEEKQ